MSSSLHVLNSPPSWLFSHDADVLAGLPRYELGPGQSGRELVVNLVIYGFVVALLGCIAWLAALFVVESRKDRRQD